MRDGKHGWETRVICYDQASSWHKAERRLDEPITLATVTIPAGALRPDSCVVIEGHLESADEALELPTVPIVVIDSVLITEAEESE